MDSYNASEKANVNHANIAPVIDRRMRSRQVRIMAKKSPRDLRFFLPVAAVLLALAMTIAIMSAFVGITGDVTAFYSDHQPIVIGSDSDFLIPSNGVTGGSGTESDPYVIWGWNINTTGKSVPGIVISNTQMHFVIRNVWVHGDTYNDGIELINVCNASVEDSRVDNNSAAFYFQDSFGVDIINVTMMNNPNYGIYSYSSNCWNVTNSTLNLNGYGAYIDPAVDSVRFDNCSISWNDYGGLYFYSDASNVEIVDCHIDNNQYEQGIYVYGMATEFSVRNSSVCYNAYDGIMLDDYCDGVEFTNNTIVDNDGYGLFLYGGDDILIANNTVSMNYDVAIDVGYLDAVGGCIITGNEIVANQDRGISVDWQTGIVIANNTVTDNLGNGIEVRGTYGTIENNDISANGRYGLILDSSTSYMTVSKNTFLKNGVYVIFSYQTGNDFTDNTVNGRPLVYLYEVDDYVVADAGQVVAAYSDRLTLKDLNLSEASIGVELWDCDGCDLERLDCSDGDLGIFMVNYSDSNTISDCNLSGCYVSGLEMNTGCCGNIVTNCDANDTTQISIYLYWGCDGNTISGFYGLRSGSDGARIQQSNGNRIVGCTFGYNTIYGIYLVSSTGTRVENCSSTNSMYGMVLSSAVTSYLANNTVRDCSNGGFSIGGDSDSNVVFQNVVRNCNWGVRIEGSFPYYAQSNLVLNNTIQLNAGRGVSLMNYASGNVICGNNITSNGYGVYIDGTNTNGNWIYLNNFVGNSIQATNNYAGNKNYWNSSAPMAYTYLGVPLTGYVGNYWSTYSGIDANNNGIGDTPFTFTNGADNYPLMVEGSWYYVPEFPTILMPLTAMLVVGFVVVLKRRSGK